MKILITGGAGQVAYDLKRLATQHDVFVPTREELDIADYDAAYNVIQRIKPDVVINTAAYTQVDRAEQEIQKTFSANFYGPKHLAMICEEFQCRLLHLSTDYVFDGQLNRPYLETDAVSPINVYGESKLRGEEEIQRHCQQHLILRVSAVFGVHGNNFVKTMLRLAHEKEILRVVSDQITCPTPAADIAATLLALCDFKTAGIFHYCGTNPISWYEFAKQTIAKAGRYETLHVKEIQAITTSEYPTAAKRPAYSVLNCEKIKSIYGINQPNWELGLDHVISTLYTA